MFSCEKNSPKSIPPLSKKINTQFLLWEKVAQAFVATFRYNKKPEVNNSQKTSAKP
jgi:hypothetical protein